MTSQHYNPPAIFSQLVSRFCRIEVLCWVSVKWRFGAVRWGVWQQFRWARLRRRKRWRPGGTAATETATGLRKEY